MFSPLSVDHDRARRQAMQESARRARLAHMCSAERSRPSPRRAAQRPASLRMRIASLFL